MSKFEKLCSCSDFKYVPKFFDLAPFRTWRLILLPLSVDWPKRLTENEYSKAELMMGNFAKLFLNS